MKTPKFKNLALLEKIAHSLGYSVTNLSPVPNKTVLKIQKGSKFYIADSSVHGFYPEVYRWQKALLDNTHETQLILNQLGIKTIPTEYYHPNQFSSEKDFSNSIRKSTIETPLLLKPNRGLDGRGIIYFHNKNGLLAATKLLYRNHTDFLLQPILNHPEYRLLIINGEAVALQSKEFPSIVGDGKSTIKSLLTSIKPKAQDPSFIKHELSQRSLKLSSVLPVGQTFAYHITRKSTQHHNKDGVRFGTSIQKNIDAWAKRLVKNIGCQTIGVDIFAPNGLNKHRDFIIIELNANPGFDYFVNEYDRYEDVREMWTKILKQYFSR